MDHKKPSASEVRRRELLRGGPHARLLGRKNKALVGTVDALDFGETDPAWLKSKGDEFYRGGDFRSVRETRRARADVSSTPAIRAQAISA